jgi:hypothetical protein
LLSSIQAEIAAKTVELGGQHKYDLTPDCTHLIVGDYNTPKYRHVAKERPDVRAMAAGWVEAVRNLWVEDADIDFLALEKEWQLRTFEMAGGELPVDGDKPQHRKLLCCMTGFEDPDERQQIIDKIESNGGLYTGDLTKRVTHLIVYKPEGRKYHAAKSWGVSTVTVEWVNDSVERGLILDEKLYDPVLPQRQRGLGAWNKLKARVSSLGKRLREKSAAQDEGRRKLRKTTSMKLNSQRDNLWGDILGKPQASEPVPPAAPQSVPAKPALPPARTTQPTQPSGPKSMDTLSSLGVPEDSSVFASCCFHVHGFSAQKTEILVNTIASLGGLILHSVEEVVSASGAQLAHRFLIVPQTSTPETHPRLPDNVHIITEFYIERCLHKKYFFDPSYHTIGRPFPMFPIPGFERLTICTAGFTGVDLNQVDKSVRQLGATYKERFTADVSLLVCPSLSVVRKQKLELALAWKVPVVSADWLWECISTGFNTPIKRFLFPELKQNLDESAFVTAREGTHEPTQRRKSPSGAHNSNISAATHFETAPTHANISFGNKTLPSGALSEASSNSLNKAPTTPRKPGPPAPRKPMSRITSEVADSEATDGDVGQPDDIPQNEENTEKPIEPQQQQEEVRRKAEAAKAAAERLAISTKLVTTLLDSTTTVSAPAAIPPPDAGSGDETPAALGALPKPTKRRKRNILGRAISNVSAASSGSNGGESGSVSGGGIAAAGGSVTKADTGRDAPPAATQLEYEDPEARRYKEQLMCKMMGTAAGGKNASFSAARQEKLTLAEMGGYDVQQQGQYDAVGVERRTRRRGAGGG